MRVPAITVRGVSGLELERLGWVVELSGRLTKSRALSPDPSSLVGYTSVHVMMVTSVNVVMVGETSSLSTVLDSSWKYRKSVCILNTEI
jgi:hypothetical protein